MQIDLKPATVPDAALLASWNFQLIQDERHPSQMSTPELEVRMRDWLNSGTYRAVVFQRDGVPVGYALFGVDPDSTIFLRQFFIAREHRRLGIGTAAMNLLLGQVIPRDARITVVVLAHNEAGKKFWASIGFAMHAHIMERPARQRGKG